MSDDSQLLLESVRERSRALFTELQAAAGDDGRTQAAREALIELHLPLVDHCARRFTQRGEPFEDLVQVGTIGLIKAVDRFDLERGVEFSTYATPTIIGETSALAAGATKKMLARADTTTDTIRRCRVFAM